MSYGYVKRMSERAAEQRDGLEEEGLELASEEGQQENRLSVGDFVENLIKLIPGEAMAAYVVLIGLIGQVSPTPVANWGETEFALLLIALLSLVLVIIGASHRTAFNEKRKQIEWKRVDVPHVVIAAISFIIYVYAQEKSVFNLLGLYFPLIGSILLVFWVVLSSYLFPSVFDK
jgi:hypothetical protein